jgi:putative membrane protein
VIAIVAGGTLWTLMRHDRHRNWQLGAIGLLALLYLTPLCTLPSALFSARVVHHIVLATVLAPLIVGALRLEQRALPGSLAVLTAVQALVFWAWHAPPLYAAALANDALFWAMQITITLSALLTFSGRALYAPHWLTTQAWGFSPLEDQQVAGLVMWAPASGLYLMAALVTLYRSMPQAEAARS